VKNVQAVVIVIQHAANRIGSPSTMGALMKAIQSLFAGIALVAACGSAAAFAMPAGQDRDEHRDDQHDAHAQPQHEAWQRGHAVPEKYRANSYVVTDYKTRHLREPPRGYHWIRDEDNNFLLVAISTGVIADLVNH
jgi:Ni/Co efflux regulator RcnB